MRFAGKVIVITGGAQGIGRATAQRFLSEGAKVVIADINAERLAATAAEIGTPDTLLAILTDVSRKDQVDALVARTVATFGRIDVMVNNAGIAPVMEFLDVTEEIYDRVLAVNLKGTFLGTQAAARAMIAQGQGGVIINMSSINSGLANPNVATYAISKGGMNQVTSTAAVALLRMASASAVWGRGRLPPKSSKEPSPNGRACMPFSPAPPWAGWVSRKRSRGSWHSLHRTMHPTSPAKPSIPTAAAVY